MRLIGRVLLWVCVILLLVASVSTPYVNTIPTDREPDGRPLMRLALQVTVRTERTTDRVALTLVVECKRSMRSQAMSARSTWRPPRRGDQHRDEGS